MTNASNIKMSFICNQDWNAMKPSENGRYCAICKKEVHDFTSKSKPELQKIGNGTCGVFLPYQVEEGLVPIRWSALPKLRGTATAVAALVGFELQTLKAQTYVDSKVRVEIAVNDSLNGDSVVKPSCADSTKSVEEYVKSRKHIRRSNHGFMRIGRRYFYWTRKFPFIISRRALMGAWSY